MNRKKHTRLFALVLFSVAVLLRIALAVQPGLWADEIFSLAMATGHSLEHPAADANPALGDYVEPPQAQTPSLFRRYMQHETPPAGAGRVIRAVLLSDTNPPLYYLLLNVWTRYTGTSDTALRLFSTLWALACFPLLWTLGRKIGEESTVWIACVLFTFSPRALHFSSEGRMYSLVWFLALLLAWSTFALANHGPRWYLVLLWSLAGASGLLTHYFFVFIWLACFAWLWLHPGALSRAHLTGAAVLMGLLILPWYLQIPGSLSRWRVTGGWLANPLSWKQALSSPFILAWSQLSGRGPWGGSFWADCLAAGLYGLLIVVILRQGLRHLFSKPRLMLWLWLFASCLGPALFDLIMHTCASTIPRYALPALPVAMLIAALGINSLPRKKQVAFILLILLAWLPGIHGLYSSPSRPWESYPAVTSRLEASIQPADLVIVHSIPSGILGVARYMGSSTPIASWVVQLEQRRVPADLDALLADRRKVALIKIHDLNNPSPAEVWLREHSTLEDHYIWHPPPRASGWPKSEILFFSPAQGEMFSP